MGVLSKRLLFPTILLAMVSVAGPPLSSIHGATFDRDSLVGVWSLNVAKSKFLSSPAPKSQTRTYETHPNGIKATIETTYSDGKSTTIQYVASYDSVEYPITGSLQFDAIAMKKIDDFTAEATLSHAGKEIAIARRVISEDGLTMTVTFRMNVGLNEVTNVSVFDKVLTSETPLDLN
jgi:hypothetical protein